jgi:hypothetical protein
MLIPEYYYLSEAAKVLDRSESFLIRLGIAGKLKFYVQPKNWAHRKDNAPLTASIINEPILIDDLDYLRKLENGADCVMYFSGQYPDSYLEDLDVAELEVTNDAGEEFSNPQFGVQITKDRLMLKAEDLALLLPKQNTLPEQQVEAALVIQTDGPKPRLVANTKDPKADDDDPDEALAALFDPLPVEALAKMFFTKNDCAIEQWKKWADKASANRLKDARQGRAMFNPYKAGKWFVRKGAEGWDDARLYRTLKNNLPARSRDDAYLITGELD